MDAQRREAITEWDARDFSGGFAGIRRVAGDGFSGAVTDGAGWLFLTDGRVVGVVDADLDAFADASGTVYRAPHEALPVLFAMQETGGKERAQYYTNDTPLTEADRKLSQGGFTGYVELSENVLSGDYYVAYTGGESMAAAFVGNARRLETGDDAFDLAADEVGIYAVHEVDLDVRDLPSGDETRTSDGDSGDAVDSGPPVDSEDTVDSEDAVDSEDTVTSDDAVDSEDTVDSENAVTSDDGDVDGESDGVGPGSDGVAPVDPDPGDVDAAEVGDAGPASNAESASSSAVGTESDGDATADAASPGGDGSADDPGPSGESRSAGDVRSADGRAADAVRVETDRTAPDEGSADVFSEEAEWREQKSIPALDPSEASDPPADGRNGTSGGSRNRSPRDRSSSGSSEPRRSADERSPTPRSTERSAPSRSAVSQRERGREAAADRVDELESALRETKAERDELADERDELAAERDELADERGELAADLDQLESEVEELRAERDRLRDDLSEARDRLPAAERSLTPAEAREGTNLFIRYDSKEGATLADAHEGRVEREALRENLRVERHTSFETEGLAVDGRPFDEFLEGTIEYGFTRWLVEDLPFEVRGTGNEGTLRDLYDALPEVDRAEIGGTVSVRLREDGEEVREQRAFDLVLRDRMGHPLFVADLNDSRDPTAEGTLESLVGNGHDVAESNETFAAAFAVTESFFEPGALETASDAVGGGLFSRSKRASFVKLSRKRGYHLCLVEARDGGFHMTVPDL